MGTICVVVNCHDKCLEEAQTKTVKIPPRGDSCYETSHHWVQVHNSIMLFSNLLHDYNAVSIIVMQQI